MPFTTAARYGVLTPKCGTPSFSILKIALPNDCISLTSPDASAASGTATRLLGATVTKSRSWTSTARPLPPVDTVSPASTAAPRCAGRDSLPWRIPPGPDGSDTRQASDCAIAPLLAVSIHAASTPRAGLITLATLSSLLPRCREKVGIA